MPSTRSMSWGALILMIGTVLHSIITTDSIPTDIDESGVKSYLGYKLLRTSRIPESKIADALLLSLDGKHGVHFWTFPKADETADILASPRLYPHVKSLLEELGIKHDVLHNDINELIQQENIEAAATAAEQVPESRQLATQRMNWKSYHRYNVIYAYCQSLASQSPTASGATVTVETIGTTTENRDIILVKVSNGGGGTKPAIWMDGGMHAREWISPATVTYILDALVNNPAKSQEMLNEFDWYIVPVINVDGYEYTYSNDRFWRKTRSRTGSFLGCRGVDPNRNWGYKWGGAGTSNDPCSDIYRGPNAFSEPETRAVSKAILNRRDKIKLYLTFHSYSQLLLVPWGYGNEKPVDYPELYNLGVKGKEALEATYGTKYQIGTAPDLLYAASGGSDDWAKGGAGIKWSYTFELRDTGRYGFSLPANQIVPTGEETLNAVRALAMGLRDILKGRTPQFPKLPNRPIKLPSRVPGLPPSGVISTKDFSIPTVIDGSSNTLIDYERE